MRSDESISSRVQGADVRFTSVHSLDAMFHALARAGRRWVRRSYRGDYLLTATLVPPGGEPHPTRIRIDPDFEDRRYRLAAWRLDQVDGEELRGEIERFALAPAGAWEIEELPADVSAMRPGCECAVSTFDTDLSLEEIHERLRGNDVRNWTLQDERRPYLRAAFAMVGGLEQVRWYIRPRAERYVVELLYDADIHDEVTWQALCGEVLDVLLPSVAARAIGEPVYWRVRIRKLEHNRAWSFASSLTLEAMREVLLTRGGPPWIERESHWYGDYLASIDSGAYAEETRLRIFLDETRYVLDVRWESEHPSAHRRWDALQNRIHQELLPALRAREIAEAEPYD